MSESASGGGGWIIAAVVIIILIVSGFVYWGGVSNKNSTGPTTSVTALA